jgi:Kyakuja-Dileera-Zisupton transposase
LGDILFVYDAGCTFSATINNSTLASLAMEQNFKTCTGSFHGAAHNHPCQVDFLIGLQEGAGIEDGEGNE